MSLQNQSAVSARQPSRALLAVSGVAIAALVLLCQPTAGAAQALPGRGIERLDAGQSLRIQTGHNGRVEGRFARLGTDSLGTQPFQDARYIVLSDAAGSVSIDDILEVRVRRSSWLAGALIGGVVGGGAGAALGAAGDNEDVATGETLFQGWMFERHPALDGGVAGAMLGAAVGTLTGLVFPHWQLQYRR